MAQVGFDTIVSYALVNGAVVAKDAAGIVLQTYSMVSLQSNNNSYIGLVTGINYGNNSNGSVIAVATVDVQGAYNLGWKPSTTNNPTPVINSSVTFSSRGKTSLTLLNPPRSLYSLSNVSTVTTTTTGTVTAGSNVVIPLASATGVTAGTILQVAQTDGTIYRAHVTSLATNNATTAGILGVGIASGATVTIWSLQYNNVLTHYLTSPIPWPSSNQNQSGNSTNLLPSGEYFTDVAGGFYPISNEGGGSGYWATSNDILAAPGPIYSQAITHKAFIHVGAGIELNFKGLTGAVYVKVDGQYISLFPWLVANDGGADILYLPFGSVAERRIDVIGYNMLWGGVWTVTGDTIYPAPARGPKCVVLGASFVQGTGNGGVYNGAVIDSWPRWMGDYLGWERVTPSGVGGTGYIANSVGANYNYLQRVSHDIPSDTDVVILSGDGPGINDWGSSNANASVSAIAAACATCIQAVRAQAPNAVIIVQGSMATRGVSAQGFNTNATPASQYAIDLALQQTAAANGAYFVSLINMKFPSAYLPTVTQLTAAVTAGASSFQSTLPYGARNTVQIDNERCEILSVSGTGPYTHTIYSTFQQAHAAGATVIQTGQSLWRGTGIVGAVGDGYGNTPTWVSADGTHPSSPPYGHQGIGMATAQQIINLGIF